MCVLSIKVAIRKKPGILFNDPRVSMPTVVEGDPTAPFSIAATPGCRGGRY